MRDGEVGGIRGRARLADKMGISTSKKKTKKKSFGHHPTQIFLIAPLAPSIFF